jgi:hypothetical protein
VERKKKNNNNKKIIIIRNGAKTISLQMFFGRLNKKQSKNNKSPNVVWET